MSVPASTARHYALRPPVAPPGRPRPSLRLVGRPRRTARYVVVIVLVAAAGVLGVVSLSALAAEAAFEARALQSEVAELSVLYDELTSEVASLEAPARIRAIAQGELKMVRAESSTFLVAEASASRRVTLTDRIKPVFGQ